MVKEEIPRCRQLVGNSAEHICVSACATLCTNEHLHAGNRNKFKENHVQIKYKNANKPAKLLIPKQLDGCSCRSRNLQQASRTD